VAAFAARGASVTVGDQLFALDVSGGVRELRVVDNSAVSAKSAADLYWSSEEMKRFLLCDKVYGLLPGAVAMNERGESVGIVAGNTDDGLLVVPVNSFIDVVDEVFKGRGAVRPYLGVHYLDLSEPIAMADSALPRRGALLAGTPDGRRPAVAKDSPAATGLREGDIIVSVNDELISDRRTLSELLASYFPGMTVTLGVKRRGLDVSVDLTFAERPK
jgi:S1-C subfamily serine protease